MRNFTNQNQKGFSTLLIVILLGGVALALTLTLSTSSLWSIRGSIDSKSSNVTKSLVNACAEVALEAMRENNSYTGSGSVVLSSNSCLYTVANTGGTTRSVSVSGTVNGITRKLSINTASFNPLVIDSWQEVP
jgi:hypothetical protein